MRRVDSIDPPVGFGWRGRSLEAAVLGTPLSNTARLIGKLSPEGNGLMQALNIGAVASDPRVAGVGLTGFVAKRAADALTNRAVDNARNIVRVGGDATALQVPPNALQRFGAAAPSPIAAFSLGTLYGPQ